MDLSEAQRRLLDHVADHWLAHGEWPRVIRLKLELKNQGVDLVALLGDMPQELCRRTQVGARDERLGLTLAGLELTKSGAGEVPPCLALVRLAAARLIETRDPGTRVTTEDLAALCPGATPEVVRRRAALLYEEWPGGRGMAADGAGHYDADMDLVRHESVKSAHDFIVRRWARSRGELPEQVLEPSHETILRWIAAEWSKSSQWPRVLDAVIDLRRTGDVLALLAEIPMSLLRRGGGNAQDRLQVSLRGIRRFSDSPAPEHAVAVLTAAATIFEETYGDERVELSTLAQRARLPVDAAATATRLLSDEGRFGIRVSGGPTQDGSVDLDERLLSWASVRDPEALVAVATAARTPDVAVARRTIWDVDLHWDGPTANHGGSSRIPLIADTELAERCGDLLRLFAEDESVNRLDSLVLQASVVVEARLRVRSGAAANVTGENLVNFAFDEKSPRVRLSTHPSEQQGAAFLFRGFFRWIRNPAAHRLDPSVSVGEAIRGLMICDYLLALLARPDEP